MLTIIILSFIYLIASAIYGATVHKNYQASAFLTTVGVIGLMHLSPLFLPML